MRNGMRVLSIIAMVAVIGFSMAACDDGSGNGDGGGSAVLGSTLYMAYTDVKRNWG